MSHASEKVGFVYMLIKSLLSYHHAFSPVNVAREQTTSLKTLLEVTSRSIKMFKLRSIQDTPPFELRLGLICQVLMNSLS